MIRPRKGSRSRPIQNRSGKRVPATDRTPPDALPSNPCHATVSRGDDEVRLHKYLSDLGLGSRRQIEAWVVSGRIHVDGAVAQLGQKVTGRSRIHMDGRPVPHRFGGARPIRLLAYHKPEGEICTRDDPGNRPTVFQHLPRIRHARWVAVGRLDINTQGLLLFTDHGELANRLMQPDTGLEREYLCRVFGEVDHSTLDVLRKGVLLDGHEVGFLQVLRVRGEGANTWYRVIVTEGRYREIRRLWGSVGCRVNRLLRVRYGPVKLLRSLPPGRWVELSRKEVHEMVQLSGMTMSTPAAEKGRSVRPHSREKPRKKSGRQARK